MSTKRREQETALGFRITSINEFARKCNITMTISRSGKADVVKYYKRAKLSRLLLWMIKNSKVVVGQDYHTDRYSNNAELGPIRLVDTIDKFGDVVHTFHTLTDIKVAPGIHSFIESRDSDLLALINKKHSFLNSIFTKSLVKEIGYKPQVPVLVMHNVKD
jgi:hypothetical protein